MFLPPPIRFYLLCRHCDHRGRSLERIALRWRFRRSTYARRAHPVGDGGRSPRPSTSRPSPGRPSGALAFTTSRRLGAALALRGRRTVCATRARFRQSSWKRGPPPQRQEQTSFWRAQLPHLVLLAGRAVACAGGHGARAPAHRGSGAVASRRRPNPHSQWISPRFSISQFLG